LAVSGTYLAVRENKRVTQTISALTLADVRKNFGATEIIRGVSLDIPAGTIAGGANVILLDEPTVGMSRSETGYAMDLIRTLTRGAT
jgi:ABC-type branched-subunit amino acid transport system ATPase component